jgi:hypothetical protein
VWIGPGLGLIFGVVLLGVVLVSWRRAPNLTPSPVAPLDPEVADELRQFRGELGQ